MIGRIFTSIGLFFLKGGGNNMAIVIIYVTLIVNDRRTFESVPNNLKPAVEAELLAMGLGTNGKPLEV